MSFSMCFILRRTLRRRENGSYANKFPYPPLDISIKNEIRDGSQNIFIFYHYT